MGTSTSRDCSIVAMLSPSGSFPGVRSGARRSSAVLGAAAHAAGAGARLAGGALRRGDPEHAHRLEAEPEALAPVGRADVEPGEVAHALEPVAHGVAMGVELLGGSGDVAVALQERLERLHEV